MGIEKIAVESLVIQHDESFWRGKRVLLTGHTGFKGGWLSLWLSRLGAEVTGIALPPLSKPNLYQAASIGELVDSHLCDIRDPKATAAIVARVQPQIVLHLAAQPLVRASYRDPLGTYGTNIMGTAHVLEALRGHREARVALCITTDKVYRNMEWPYPYRESDALGGHDPYSSSKACAELVTASYRDAYLKTQGVAVATARAGNVIGGGDWSEDRLLPDAIRAWQAGATLNIRRPDAVRPWQHVLEPLSGYLHLVKVLWKRPELAGAYNFGPPSHEAASVQSVVALARETYGQGKVAYGSAQSEPHEAGSLKLDTSLSQSVLGLQQRWSLEQSIKNTMHWYREHAAGANARDLCHAQINLYNAC